MVTCSDSASLFVSNNMCGEALLVVSKAGSVLVRCMGSCKGTLSIAFDSIGTCAGSSGVILVALFLSTNNQLLWSGRGVILLVVFGTGDDVIFFISCKNVSMCSGTGSM